MSTLSSADVTDVNLVTYNEMGRTGGRDQSAIRTWPCACAWMCRAYIRQLAHAVMAVSDISAVCSRCSLLLNVCSMCG